MFEKVSTAGPMLKLCVLKLITFSSFASNTNRSLIPDDGVLKTVVYRSCFTVIPKWGMQLLFVFFFIVVPI